MTNCVGISSAICARSALWTCWAGFKQVVQIVDGMEGGVIKDPDSVYLGQRLKNGWKNSGYPWTNELTPERMLPAQH